MRRHLRNYERPDGWSKGHPEVLVTKNIIKRLGEPVVNYDSLHRFVTDKIGVPHDDKTFIKLFGRSRNSLIGGFHCPYTRTVHVNPLTAEKLFPDQGGTMRIVAHELRHRGDSVSRKGVTAFDVATRMVVYKAGFEIAETLPMIGAVPMIGAIAARQAWYVVEPAERRSRKQEEDMETSPHQADILFPNTVRAAHMAVAGLVPEEHIERLGGSDKLRSLAVLKPLALLITRDTTQETSPHPPLFSTYYDPQRP